MGRSNGSNLLADRHAGMASNLVRYYQSTDRYGTVVDTVSDHPGQCCRVDWSVWVCILYGTLEKTIQLAG